MKLPQPAPHLSPTRRRGISPMGVATLVAVFAVVIVITLSSLRGIAMQENEDHVQRLLRALGKSAASEVHAAPPADLRALTEADTGLERELNDSRWSGERLFRHGYLVHMIHQGADGPVLVAWPADHGNTGNRAFMWTPTEGLRDLRSPDQPYSGLVNAPTPAELPLPAAD